MSASLLSSLSETQRSALISLLADEDESVYHTIREKIISSGPEAIDWLRPYLLSGDAVLRRRAKEIVDHFGKQSADTDFLAFCLKQGEEFNLEDGIWGLVRTEYPSANPSAYGALLDSYATDLRTRLDFLGDPDNIVGGLNEFIFDRLGFVGDEENYYDPQNSYLNRVLDRRTGNPISLCIVYMLLGRRLKLPITGIGLPGHFICRFQNSKKEIYIDVFNRGQMLTKADCVKYLLHMNHTLDEGHLLPVSSRRILLRICANLHQIYAQLEDETRVARFQRYLVALAK